MQSDFPFESCGRTPHDRAKDNGKYINVIIFVAVLAISVHNFELLVIIFDLPIIFVFH